nr:phage holin, LLH family [Brevibacillus laterosporus]
MSILLGQIVLDVAHLLLLAVGTWAIFYLVKFLKGKIKKEHALRAVQYAEQAFVHLKGSEKYNEAVKYFVASMDRKKIKVTDEEVKGLIESTLHEWKDELNKQMK